MDNRIEKIRDEIEKLNANIEKVFLTDDVSIEYMHGFKNALTMLSKAINSLQEESKNKPFVDIEIPFGVRDSELIEESISIPEGCYAVIEGNKVVIRKGEEPVSEDLEEEIYKMQQLYKTVDLYDGYPATIYKNDIEYIARHFVQWQKQKDIELADTILTLARKDIEENTKQQMMKDALKVSLYADGDFLTVDYDFRQKGFNVGDRIKVLIVKEE